MKTDVAIAALGGVAIGGMVGPVLFPMMAGVKTASYLASIAASGSLAYLFQSGAAERLRHQDRITRESNHEIFLQQQASREAIAEYRLQMNELLEVLAMLDQLDEVSQRYYLQEMGLLELMPVYVESRMLREASQPIIEVPAAPVKEPAPTFSADLNWAVDSVVSQSMQPAPTVTENDDTFLEVDLGRAIAEMMVGGEVPLSVMLACPARTGKSTLLAVTIAWLHKLTGGHCSVNIFNGKEKRDPKTGELVDRFLGLVDDPTRYHAVETLESAKDFADELEGISQTMTQPRQHPEVLLLDEYNNIRARLSSYDMKAGIQKAKGNLTKLDANVGYVVTQGSSRNVFLLFTSHSSYVKNIGIDRSYQKSLYSIILGRGGVLDELYASLKGQNAIVQNAVRANELLHELQMWENSPHRDHSKVVALTNLVDGKFGLYFVKHHDLSQVQFSSVQHEKLQDYPAVPRGEEPPAQSDVPLSRQVEASQEQHGVTQVIEELHEWIKTLGRIPTDPELSARLEQLLKVVPSPTIMRGVKQLLSKHGHQFDS